MNSSNPYHSGDDAERFPPFLYPTAESKVVTYGGPDSDVTEQCQAFMEKVAAATGMAVDNIPLPPGAYRSGDTIRLAYIDVTDVTEAYQKWVRKVGLDKTDS